MRVGKEIFKEAVSIVTPAIDKRGNIPVLSNIKLASQDDSKLSVTATDLEIGIRTIIRADVSDGEKVLLPGKRLGRITPFLKGEGDVQIDINENKVRMEFDKASYSMAIFPVEEFPESPFDIEEVTFHIEMTAGELDDALRKTSFCISRDESRYMLTGVCIKGEGGKTYFVATDGFRMSIVEFEKESKINLIIPKKCVQETRRLIKKIPTEVKIGTDSARNKVVFSFDKGNTLLWGSVIDAEYPDFLSVVPNHEEFIVVNREELLSAVKQVATIADDPLSTVRFKISPDKNVCTLYMKETGDVDIPEESSIEVSLNMNELTEKKDIGFAFKFLSEALASFKSPELYIFMSRNVSPIMIKGEGDKGYTHIIMPKK